MRAIGLIDGALGVENEVLDLCPLPVSRPARQALAQPSQLCAHMRGMDDCQRGRTTQLRSRDSRSLAGGVHRPKKPAKPRSAGAADIGVAASGMAG